MLGVPQAVGTGADDDGAFRNIGWHSNSQAGMVTTHQTSRDERPVWILAGEPSGDRYGADLALALRERAPPRVVRGMGCARMREAGADLIVDASNLSVVGFVEVLKHLGDFRRAFHELLAEAEREPPAAVILIDNPGFNLRIAKQFHRRGIPVLYYVCPQVWAWGKKRIPLMAQTVDRSQRAAPRRVGTP